MDWMRSSHPLVAADYPAAMRLLHTASTPRSSCSARNQPARIDHFTANTVCDGLRTLIGESNLEALRAHRVEVITVTDEESIAAMRELWRSLKLVVEVSSATVFAAVLKQRERFAGKRVGLVLTGGTVDLDALPW
jgi:threonine dehydratase